MKAKELMKILDKVDGEIEVRIVTQYDEFTEEKYHNEISDVQIGTEDEENIVVLFSDYM